MKNKSKFIGFAAIIAAIGFAALSLAGCPAPGGGKNGEDPVVVDENTVATPTASPAAGDYTETQTVSLSTTTEDAAIYYTLDGTAPTVSSTLYESAISVSATTTLKAFAVKEGMDDSGVLTAVYKIVLPFTTAPALELEPGSAKITYSWTASDPAADTYDVYWKAGDGLTAAAVKDGGTKIPNATSGGKITGLENGTEYCVIVTANKAGYKSIDSEVAGAIPVAIRYAITGSGATFTAIRDGSSIEVANAKDKPIQDVIDAIKTDAAGEACIIEFGDGDDALDIGTASASFSGTGWGFVELSGKITGAVTTTGTIVIADTVSVTSVADITNTSGNANARAIYYNSTGTLTISGGKVEAPQTYAIYNNAAGTVHISGGTVSAITGGSAVNNQAAGTVNISGGEVSVTTGRAVNNVSTGAVNISGGTVKATETGYAVYNASTGKITVSGSAKISSLITSSTGGTIYLAAPTTDNTDLRLEITGGTVENNSSGYGACAINNASTGGITISGGTVQATQDTVYAIRNNAAAALTISGGTISSAGSGYTVFNNATGPVTINAGTVSTTTGYSVYNSAGTVTISGGTISSTGTGGYAVYNNAAGTVTINAGTISGTGGSTYPTVRNNGAGTININGGTVSAISGRAVENNAGGTITIKGGTVSAASGRAVYNNATGTITITGGTFSATTGVAVYNQSTGKINVSQAAGATTKITSANVTANEGTIYLNAPSGDSDTAVRLEITGGIVENTGTNGRAIYNASTGGVTISAGTVQATGSGTVYSVYSANALPGALTITRPPAVIIGNTYPAQFSNAPVLTIVPDSNTIAYTWTAPSIAPDNYDVYWKAGLLSAEELKKTGTKITGATSGGTISGLVNSTTYSVVVTANKATNSGIDSIDSWVMAAKPGSPLYVISGSGTAFTATKKTGNTSTTVGTADQQIQDVINAIRGDASQAACLIQFGDGSAALTTDTNAVTFTNITGATWGAVEISGKITSSVNTNTRGTIIISSSVSLTSGADITNSSSSSTAAYGVYHSSTGTLKISGGSVSATSRAVNNYYTGAVDISGGTVQATTGVAVYNVSTGKITVSGTARVVSAITTNQTGTIHIGTTTETGGDRLVIEGGTVENISTGNGNSYAVYNESSGAVKISGGTVKATTSIAVYNASTGAVNISGGTVSATTGYAVYNSNTGIITVSQPTATPTLISSANTNAAQGTIHIANNGNATAARLEILGGTIQNTSTSANGNAIYNASPGGVTMSGGTVSSTATSGRAILNNSTGAFNMSGGTVSVTGTSARAIHNQSTGTVTISGGTVQAPVNDTAYAIYNNSTGNVQVDPAASITGARYP